ncbi:MAG TPA: hypothetical protein VGZ00_10170 [Candidatus Baltobacteraceae bacterium]|jgi:hypothetical protein|nr:hypothetical protein [Candidatus Baltobacteraceae bacterium]
MNNEQGVKTANPDYRKDWEDIEHQATAEFQAALDKFHRVPKKDHHREVQKKREELRRAVASKFENLEDYLAFRLDRAREKGPSEHTSVQLPPWNGEYTLQSIDEYASDVSTKILKAAANCKHRTDHPYAMPSELVAFDETAGGVRRTIESTELRIPEVETPISCIMLIEEHPETISNAASAHICLIRRPDSSRTFDSAFRFLAAQIYRERIRPGYALDQTHWYRYSHDLVYTHDGGRDRGREDEHKIFKVLENFRRVVIEWEKEPQPKRFRSPFAREIVSDTGPPSDSARAHPIRVSRFERLAVPRLIGESRGGTLFASEPCLKFSEETCELPIVPSATPSQALSRGGGGR